MPYLLLLLLSLVRLSLGALMLLIRQRPLSPPLHRLQPLPHRLHALCSPSLSPPLELCFMAPHLHSSPVRRSVVLRRRR